MAMDDNTSDVSAISYGSEIGLDTKHSSPPTNAYIGVDDVLGISCSGTQSIVTITVFARILLPDGTIVPNQWQMTPPATRTGFSYTLNLPEGFLLSVTAQTNSIAWPGAMFVRLFLTRGNPVTNPIAQLLACGYVSQTNNLSWPPGRIMQTTEGRGLIRSITGTVPGVASEISETVPTNAIWRLISVRYSLTTSASVASRGSNLVVDDGTNAFGTYVPATSQAAGNTFAYTWGAGATLGNVSLAASCQGMPNDLFLTAGMRFRTSTTLMQAADQYTAPQYLVEEWILG